MFTESLKLSASVNGLYITAPNLMSFLGEYSVNLAIWNHDETYKVSLVGSASPVRYRKNYLLICTNHQIGDADLEDISILTSDGEFAVTSSGYSALNSRSKYWESDLRDIVIFNFNDACEKHTALQKKFFRIDYLPPDGPNEAVVAVLNYGYPSQDQLYELHDKNHIGSRRRATTLKVHRQPPDETLLHLKPRSKIPFNPDGLSGGPNFALHRTNEGFVVSFAGVTVRAGHDDLYLVKIGYIKHLMDLAIDLRS